MAVSSAEAAAMGGGELRGIMPGAPFTAGAPGDVVLAGGVFGQLPEQAAPSLDGTTVVGLAEPMVGFDAPLAEPAEAGLDQTTSAYWRSLYREPGVEEAEAVPAVHWATHVSTGPGAATEDDGFDAWLAQRRLRQDRAQARWDTGDPVYPDEAADLHGGLVATQAGLLGSLTDRPAGYKKLMPNGPDGAVSTKAVDLGYLAEVPTTLQRRGDTPQAPFIAPATVREAKRNADIDGQWPALLTEGGGVAAGILAVIKGAPFFPVAGAVLGGVVAPILTGYKFGDFAGRNESLNMADKDKRLAKLVSQIGMGALALAAGAAEGAATGFIVTGFNVGGAAVGAVVGAGLGLASYMLGRRRRGLFLKHLARGRAEEIAQTSKTKEGDIATEQVTELVKHSDYEPGTDAMAARKAAEAEVRGPVLRTLAYMAGAAALAGAGVWAAKAKLAIGAGLTFASATVIAGGAGLLGTAIAAGRGIDKWAERRKSPRWAATARVIGGLLVTGAGVFVGSFFGPGGAIAGGTIAATGYMGGRRMRRNEIKRREKASKALEISQAAAPTDGTVRAVAAVAPPAAIQAPGRNGGAGQEVAAVTTNDAEAEAEASQA